MVMIYGQGAFDSYREALAAVGVEKGDWQKSKTFRKKRKKAIDYFRLMW